MANGALFLGQMVSGKPGFQSLGMIACALSVGAVFGLDLFTPLGAGVSFLYTIVVWAGVWRATPKQVIALGTVSSVLIIIGFFLSPGTVVGNAITNRVISLVSLWFVLYFGMSYRKAVDTLSEREREELLRVTFDSAPVGISIAGLEGRFVTTNVTYQRMVGYSEKELRQETNVSITHPDDYPHHHALREELIAGKRESFEIEKRNRTKNGELIWVRSKMSLIKDGVGKPRFTVAVVQDITERKRAEEELRRSEERFSKIFRSSPIAIGIGSMDEGRLIDANDRYLEFFGYRRDEMIGRTGLELGLWADPNERVEVSRLAKERGSVREFEGKFRRKSGEIAIALYSREYLQLRGETVKVSMRVDITERHRAEKELREREELLRVTFDAAPMGIAIAHLDSRHVKANIAYQRMIGYSEEELHERTRFDLTHPDDHPHNQALREELIAGKREFFEIEKRYITKSGKIIWVRNKVSLVKDDLGKPRYTVAMCQDITASKLAEETVRRSEQQLCEALDEREHLCRDLHDNIVQAIYAIGMRLEACQRLMHDHSKDVAAELAHAIGDLNGVIRDVRRYISGADPHVLSGPQLRAELAQMVKNIGAAGTLRFRLNVDAPAITRLNPEEAEHVLHIAREALSNALRHSQARRGMLSLRLVDTGICLEVSDDGVGFNPHAGNDKGGGLWNMEARAQQIGANLDIFSCSGQGARITLQIPKEKIVHDVA